MVILYKKFLHINIYIYIKNVLFGFFVQFFLFFFVCVNCYIIKARKIINSDYKTLVFIRKKRELIPERVAMRPFVAKFLFSSLATFQLVSCQRSPESNLTLPYLKFGVESNLMRE